MPEIHINPAPAVHPAAQFLIDTAKRLGVSLGFSNLPASELLAEAAYRRTAARYLYDMHYTSMTPQERTVIAAIGRIHD